MKPQSPQYIGSQNPSSRTAGGNSWRNSTELQSLLDMMIDFYWETNRSHQITQFVDSENQVQSPLVGVPFWELGGGSFDELEGCVQLTPSFEAQQPFVDLLLKLPYPSKGLRFFNVSGKPIFSEKGVFIGFQGIARDVTDNALAHLLSNNEKHIQQQLDFSENLDVTFNLVVKLTCESFLWAEGRYWSYDIGHEHLTQEAEYISGQEEYTEVNEDSISMSELETLNSPLKTAILDKEFQWHENFNAESQSEQGYESTFIFPVIHNKNVIGVFQFFSDYAVPTDLKISVFLKNLCISLASHLEKKNISPGLGDHQSRVDYLAHHSPSWYWEVDDQSQYTYFSGKAVDLNPELFNDFLGKRPWELGIKLVEQTGELQSVLQTRKSFSNHIVKAGFKTGKSLDLRFSGDPIYSPGGKFLGYRGIGQDITKRKEAEEVLRDAYTRLEVILNSTDAGLYRLTFEPGSNAILIDAWDENFARLYGCPNPENVTKEELVKRVHPHDIEVATSKLWGSINDGLSKHQNEYRILLDDGSVRWLFTSAKIQRSDDGSPESITGVAIDITARKEIEQSLQETQEQLSTALYTTSIGLFKFSYGPDADEEFGESNPLVWNFNMAPLFGYSPDEKIEEANFFANVYPGDMEKSVRMMDEHVKNRETDHQNEYRVIWPDGTIRWLYSRATLSYTEEGKLKDVIGVSVDITDRKLAEEKIQYLATHDSLTGLTNRDVFNQFLEHEIHVARRANGNFSVMFIDLDRFKVINDSLGHEVGDQLLQSMSKRLQDSVREGDVVGRMGGDEFVILAREIANDHQAAHLAKKVLKKIAEPIFIADQEYRVTASIGIATYPVDGENELTLMKNADVAMYLAKDEGKNNFKFYSASINTVSLGKLTLENDLRKALLNGEFYLDYQAKMNAVDGSVAGVEALLRWQHPDLGLVPPDQFISLAEESGIIIPIGRWVLERACEQAQTWQQQGLPPICIAVNLSPRQFSDSHLLQDITDILKKTKLRPGLLELEITESMVMNNADRAVTLLKSIKTLGVRLAIDDFGTGYSSLGQLKQFPIDTLKVDKSFIRHIPVDEEDKAITEAIIAMGKSLSLTVVAEGVETLEQQEFLQAHACDQMQGFYFSRPISAEEFAVFLRSKS